jgi:hypothetical protein
MQNLKAIYGAGFRHGKASPSGANCYKPPHYYTRLEAFTYRQGLRDGAGLVSVFSIARALGL